MVRKLNDEILLKVDELINLIKNSFEYQRYLYLKEQMKKSDILLLINEIKVLQKDIVHHLDKQKLLKCKMEELNGEPLYREYNNILAIINNWYAIIEKKINYYFEEKMN